MCFSEPPEPPGPPHTFKCNAVVFRESVRKNLSFRRIPEHLKVWGGPGGSGGSKKHIWKIFYRGDPKIRTPGIPLGSPKGPNFFIQKIYHTKTFRSIQLGLGVLLQKLDF